MSSQQYNETDLAPSAKRILDVVLAVMILVALAPLMLFIALAIKLKMGSPILFRQRRAGHRGQPFVLLKFRTMNRACDARGRLLPDGERVTALGRVLRQYSLDELPQILQVLEGQLSFVGPRPLLLRYLERYTPDQFRRHEVKPGITGLAQVSGRNSLSWEQKFELDVWYVDHQSLWLDVRIMAKTIWNVFQRRGINQPGMATVQEFMGTRQVSAESWLDGAEEARSK